MKETKQKKNIPILRYKRMRVSMNIHPQNKAPEPILEIRDPMDGTKAVRCENVV